MKIVDVSAWQETIDWTKVRKEVEMVIFRASIGFKEDTMYVENATKCDLPFGVYHYFKAGTVEAAEKEAKFFYECATQNGLQPLFFCPDIEYSTQNSKNTKAICEAALTTLKNLGAKKVGLYIGQERYSYMKDIKDKFDFIWIPRYGKNDGTANEKYKPIHNCDIWQYTDKGTVSGVKWKVDLNKLCGDKTLEWYTRDEKVNSSRALYYLGYRTLRQGNQGKDVKELQSILNELGFSCGAADGKFGAKTKAALKLFQKLKGLAADGICGKKTIQQIIG